MMFFLLVGSITAFQLTPDVKFRIKIVDEIQRKNQKRYVKTYLKLYILKQCSTSCDLQLTEKSENNFYLFLKPMFNETCDSIDQSIRCEGECVDNYIVCISVCLNDQFLGRKCKKRKVGSFNLINCSFLFYSRITIILNKRTL